MSSEKTDQVVLYTAGGHPLAPQGNGKDKIEKAFDMYAGISQHRFTEVQKQILASPPDANEVQIRPDGIVYLPGDQFRDLLTRAFGPGGWAIYPINIYHKGKFFFFHGALMVNGHYVHQAIGEDAYNPNNPNESEATCAEAASTDCIVRCCKHLSIFSQLWNKNYVDNWKAINARLVEVRHLKKRQDETEWIWVRKDRRVQYPYKEVDLRKATKEAAKEVEKKRTVDVDVDKATPDEKIDFNKKCENTIIWLLENNHSVTDFDAIVKKHTDDIKKVESVKLMTAITDDLLAFCKAISAKKRETRKGEKPNE